MSYGRFLTVLSLLVAFAALALVGVGFWRLERDQAERRDQTCVWFEGDHLEDVKTLRRTYARMPEALAFYTAAAPNSLRPFLKSILAADLARLEKEAAVDAAPAFCDEPGTGLPEPDPAIPTRPKGLFP